MATAQEIVTRAYRRLGAIDLHEQPSDAEMSNGLSALSEMINGWEADGIPTATQTLTGTTTVDSPTIADLDATNLLAPGHNVSGAGIPSGARVRRIVSPTSVEMTMDATASASVSITFTLAPLDDRFQRAVVAMLAVYMASDAGLPEAPSRVQRDAEEGWSAILAHYLQTPITTYDEGLRTSQSIAPGADIDELMGIT